MKTCPQFSTKIFFSILILTSIFSTYLHGSLFSYINDKIGIGKGAEEITKNIVKYSFTCAGGLSLLASFYFALKNKTDTAGKCFAFSALACMPISLSTYMASRKKGVHLSKEEESKEGCI